MCEKCECCGQEIEEEGFTLEELIEEAVDNISEGACLACTLEEVFEYGYLAGKQDLARESMEFYADVLEEDEEEYED